MASERLRQIERLYHSALDQNEDRRQAYLDEACAGDPDLFREVESLLAHERAGSSFLEKPALEVAAKALAGDQRQEQASAPDASIIGQTVSHYRIVAELGGGGMGVVYKAEDTRLGRPVALKFLRTEAQALGSPQVSPTSHAQALERFRREARAASALNHPNICMVHDVGEYRGEPFMVMEFLEGHTLKPLIEERPPKIPAVVDLAIQIAHALAAAHAKGIIHRDIKPTNVFVTTSGQVKILDFGLAKPQESGEQTRTMNGSTASTDPSLTSPGMTVGTAAYMSPEQARGEELDPRSDLFSFGVLLYEMASGHHPFSANSTPLVLHRILMEAPDALLPLNPQVPVELAQIIDKALEKDRELRYQSAAEMCADLKRLKRDSASDKTPASGHRSLAAMRRARRPWWTAVIPAAMAIAALVYLGIRPLAAPKVTGYNQITNDGVMKSLGGTDGVRLYLTESSGGAHWIAQMAVSGGEPARMPMPSPSYSLLDVSPDGASLLAAERVAYADGPLWSVPILGGSPRRIGSLTGSSGAWSPDGRRLVYSHHGDLFVAMSDGSQSRRVATVPGMVFKPAWSPDGRRIRFTAGEEHRRSEALWEVSADEGNLHPLFPHLYDPSGDCCGVWTSDGRYFIFSRLGQIWAMAEPRGLRRAASSPVQLTSGATPFGEAMPSKNGKQLFAVGMVARGEVVRYDPRIRQFVPFLEGISADYVSYSNDGQWIAYVAFPEGTLWRSRADGSDRLQLTSPMDYANVYMPRWSPDGSEILYTLAKPGHLPKLFHIAARGGPAQELLPASNQVNMDPTWSPDGARVCYGGPSGATPGALGPNIHIVDLHTHSVTDVPGSNDYFSPRWSPDGIRLAALSKDSTRLALFDFASGQWREMARGVQLGFPTWSHDSQHVFYVQITVNPAIMRVGVPAGKPERIVDLKDIHTTGFYGLSLSLTPDDQPIVVRDSGSQEIFALNWQAP